MIPCDVERHCSAYLVTFNDGSSVLLQTDYDQAQFVVDCGMIKAPDNWDGSPSKLPEDWSDHLEWIEKCPEHYFDIAEFDKAEDE